MLTFMSTEGITTGAGLKEAQEEDLREKDLDPGPQPSSPECEFRP